MDRPPAGSIDIVPLGGVGEIGKNMTAYRYGDEIVVVDCGVMFPEDHQLGVDLVVPDVSYLVEHQEMVKGILLTHGHEDHIGALPYVLRQVQAPLYGTRLTLGLVKAKLDEHGLTSKTKMIEVEPGDGVDLGEFDAQFIRVTHSIPEAVSIALRCPAGTLVQTGDFKFDPTPIDGKISDYALFTDIGDEGVLALISDSTNVERQGTCRSERMIGVALDRIFKEAKGRIIFTTFASNIHRLQQAITVGMKYDRKVALMGRSMVKNIRVARELGIIDIPDDVFIPVEAINNYHPLEVTVLSTGSQGEPMAALSRIAVGEHKHFTIEEGDTVILSSMPIPGNEDAVHRNINNLFKQGATVIYGDDQIHVSGHAYQDELRLMMNLTRPKFLMPVHGEARHLMLYKQMALSMGYGEDDVVVTEIGDVVRVNKEKIDIIGRTTGGSVLVDGIGIGDVGEAVLRDRKHLSQDGIFLPVIAIDRTENIVIAGPDIISRGFVFMEEAGELIEEARLLILRVVSEELTEESDVLQLRQLIRSRLGKFLFEKTGRRPMVMPVIQEV